MPIAPALTALKIDLRLKGRLACHLDLENRRAVAPQRERLPVLVDRLLVHVYIRQGDLGGVVGSSQAEQRGLPEGPPGNRLVGTHRGTPQFIDCAANVHDRHLMMIGPRNALLGVVGRQLPLASSMFTTAVLAIGLLLMREMGRIGRRCWILFRE